MLEITEEEVKQSEVISKLDGHICFYASSDYSKKGYKDRCLHNSIYRVLSTNGSSFYLCHYCYLDSRDDWRPGAIFYAISTDREVYITKEKFTRR